METGITKDPKDLTGISADQERVIIIPDPEESSGIFAIFDGSARNRYIAVAILAIIAVLSAILLTGYFSSPDAYSKTIESLDGKKDNVMTLTATSAGASAALSAIPDDTCTPLAEKIADISGDLVIVLAVIYLEKYLLTVFGFATFAFLIPAGCVAAIAALLIRNRPKLRNSLVRLAEKLVLLGLVLMLTVPASVFISDKIEATYKDSIDSTMQAVEITAQAAEDTTEEVKREEATNPIEFFQQRIEDLSGAVSSIPENIGGAVEWVQSMTSSFFEAVAVMIVLSCIIPIVVLIFLLWVVKLILGIKSDVPMKLPKHGAVGRMVRKP